MIYLKAGDQTILIVEPGNIERLTSGMPLVSQDKSVMVAYCPDIEWLAGELERRLPNDLSPELLDSLLSEGLKRRPIIRKGQANA